MDKYWLFSYEVLSFSDLSGEWRQMNQTGIRFIKQL